MTIFWSQGYWGSTGVRQQVQVQKYSLKGQANVLWSAGGLLIKDISVSISLYYVVSCEHDFVVFSAMSLAVPDVK